MNTVPLQALANMGHWKACTEARCFLGGYLPHFQRYLLLNPGPGFSKGHKRNVEGDT